MKVVHGLPIAAVGIVVLCTVTVPFYCPFGKSGPVKWDRLKLKYNIRSGVYNIPLSSDQMNGEYKYLQNHEDYDKVKMYVYPDDPRIQLMYDGHNNICGVRVAYVKDQLEKRSKQNGLQFPYSYKNKQIFKEGSALNKKFFYTDVFFIRPDLLKSGGPASRDEPLGTGVYINIEGNTWTELPRKEEDAKGTKFTQQGCFLGMGRHYFYNMSPQMKCEDHQPIFLLYSKGDLIGIGLVPFGTFDASFGRPWFEDPPKVVIKKIVPKGPDCLAEWVGTHGTTSIHMYFRSFNELNYC